jgi:hypothetical protein
MKIIYYCQSVESFEISATELIGSNSLINKNTILWCNSKIKTRLECINECVPNAWYLFLDHDCIIDEFNYKELLSIIEKRSIYPETNGHVLLGVYKNTENSSYLQQAHNWISNNWIQLRFNYNSNFYPVLLGGAFAFIKSNNQVFKSELNLSKWGSEDKSLAYVLHKNRFSFSFIEKIKISHETSASIFHFLKRAFLHGYNDELNDLLRKENKANFSFLLCYWMRRFASLRFYLVLPVLLHFFVQICGRIVRKVRPIRKENT